MVKPQNRTLKLHVNRIRMHFRRSLGVSGGESWKNPGAHVVHPESALPCGWEGQG